MKRFLAVSMCALIAAWTVSCKKDDQKAQYGKADKYLKSAEDGLKKVPAKDAMGMVKDNVEEKKSGKGLLERAIKSNNNAEYCYAVGVNVAELQLFFSFSDQPNSMKFLNDSMGFFVKLVQAHEVYPGDVEDFNAVLSKWKNRQSMNADELSADLNPIMGKIVNGVVNKYGDEGKFNLAMGMYSYKTLCMAIVQNINTSEASEVFGALKQYLEYKNARGNTYKACDRVVKNLSGGSINYTALKSDTGAIIGNYMY